jgi:alpha-mannosidase
MYFTQQKLQRLLQPVKESIHRAWLPVEAFKFHAGDIAGAAEMNCPEDSWQDFRVGQSWGGYDKVAWFRTRVTIPADMAGKKLALRFLVGPRDGGGSTTESLLYVNGHSLQGLDYWHEEAVLPPELRRGELRVAIRAWSGVLRVPPVRTFREGKLVQIDEPAEHLYFTSLAILRTLEQMGESDLRRARLLELVNEAYHCIDFTNPGSEDYYDSLASADGMLWHHLQGFSELNEIRPKVVGLGNSHLDMAWLWRLNHTREKASRTFSTVLNLMRQYPEYRYLHTSPQLFQFLKQDQPEIYEQVRQRIAEGSFEITGGMWVEADTNLSGGEALIRQILLGKKFVRREFGRDMTVLWLPDVFGYSAALPQIARKSGLKYFVTSKISWSQFNRFPYDTFYWRGLDGSELLTNFITTPENDSLHYSYIGEFQPNEVVGAWKNYQQKEINDQILMLFGWGDGGGGPTREMLESARVLKALPGPAAVEIDTAEHFLPELEERLKGKEVPVWDGELYLEYHRGTYTSQAQIKRANRMAEILYHNAEWLNVLAGQLVPGHAYPHQKLETGWEKILLHQFHDILPGSSIRAVYEDAEQAYAEITAAGEQARDEALREVATRVPSAGPALMIFNSLGWCRDDVLVLDDGPEYQGGPEYRGKTLRNPDGSLAETQVIDLFGERKRLFSVRGVPAMGYGLYPLVEAGKSTSDAPPADMAADERCLENRFYRIQLDENGRITSLFDHQAGREWILPGQVANDFQAFQDRPMNFEAWDIDIYYEEKMQHADRLEEACLLASGPLVTVLRLGWCYNHSTIRQEIWLHHTTRRIDFHTQVDWHEHQTLLKVAFPLKVRTTQAAYEIQFGVIERPTHRNTSWDVARFEVPAHKWADLSEGNGGVALLNNCKYGYDAHDSTLRLTLIKSGIEPDPQADQGLHRFTYSLLPHAGGWRESGVQRSAYELNVPLIPTPVDQQPGDLPASTALVEAEADNVIVETVKQSESGEAVVVRVYESRQYTLEETGLKFHQPIKQAVECDLIEENEQPARWSGNRLAFGITPFEIKTFKVWL